MCRSGILTAFFCLAAIYHGLCHPAASHTIILNGSDGKAVFDLDSGKFSLYEHSTCIVAGARFSANDYHSDDPGNQFSSRTYRVSENSLNGKRMEINCRFRDGIEIRWTATYFDNKPYLVLGMAITNGRNDILQLKKWAPMEQGRMYPGLAKYRAKILDGNGGGESTSVTDADYLRCRNNLLYTFDDEKGNRHSLVMGGIAYQDFEKHALVWTDEVREDRIRQRERAAGIKLLHYIDLGEDFYGSAGNEPQLAVERAWPVHISGSGIKEISSAVSAYRQIIIRARHLESNKNYSFGISWADDNGGRVQSVYADNGEGTPAITILNRKDLPLLCKGDTAEEFKFNLPAALTAKGGFRLVINCDKGPNAVASEAWLSEGWGRDNMQTRKILRHKPSRFEAAVYAEDPVGKRIDPHKQYFPSKDLFYIDGSTRDPFDALECYGRVLKAFQHVDQLSLYTFPTVCLWYASHRNYGGGPSVNDSKGAVDEMRRAIRSGITKYTKAAIRLVPDNYELSNEQGWWDDTHWQRYGSGSDNPNSVVVKGGHYNKPYETTKKWASAIRKLGGIPLTYFQTARRSQDFCDRFPQYMLFNESNHMIPDTNWLTLGKSSYDFTDAGFVTHMRSVYRNLHDGGVQGMMFDYTSTAWADYGGMDNPYSTAAGMYRTVFLLAHQGLGQPQWIHERNLERGSDLTLGLVASQRVWGDTDGITDEMVSRTGLRWYKNRVVVSYDMDAKNTEKLRMKSRDHLRQMLTMAYVASGRLLLGNSYAKMTQADVYDLSRVFPFHHTAKSARPVDAFITKWPTLYQFAVNPHWSEVTLYNTSGDSSKRFSIKMSDPNYKGGLGLDNGQQYYVYDFWNDHYVGRLQGADTLDQTLRKAEARMLSVHQALPFPQFISTNRHLMQGYLELSKVSWNRAKSVFTGIADVKADDAMVIVVAMNGYKPLTLNTSSGRSNWEWLNKKDGIIKLIIKNSKSGPIQWVLNAK